MRRTAAASLSSGVLCAYGGGLRSPNATTSIVMRARRAAALSLRASKASTSLAIGKVYHGASRPSCGNQSPECCGNLALRRTNRPRDFEPPKALGSKRQSRLGGRRGSGLPIRRSLRRSCRGEPGASERPYIIRSGARGRTEASARGLRRGSHFRRADAGERRSPSQGTRRTRRSEAWPSPTLRALAPSAGRRECLRTSELRGAARPRRCGSGSLPERTCSRRC